MNRKVNLVGTGTLTISLPSDWTGKNNISKGDDLNVEEKTDGNLIISKSDIQHEKLVKSLNVEGLKIYLEKYIAGFYKAGYDRLEIFYKSPEELLIIQNLLQKTCIGYEITDHSKNTITIEMVSELDVNEFEKIFKRNFISMELITLELSEYISKKDINGIKTCVLRHPIINKYSDFCRRCLNRHQNRFKKVGTLYTAVELLEMIADLYRAISEDIIKYNINLSKEMQELLTKTNEYFISLKELYFKFDEEKMKEFIETKKEFNKKYTTNTFKPKEKEVMIFLYIKSIIQHTYDFNGIIMTMNS